jgi:S1-C subfamily serine protease
VALAERGSRLATLQNAFTIRESLQTWWPAVDGTLPVLLGFEGLDIIEEVNGRPVRTRGEIFDELSKLGTRATQIEAELARHGKPVHLTCRIVE